MHRHNTRALNESSINLLTFTSDSEFVNWVRSNHELTREVLFLLDYELLGQIKNGLDLIEEFDLNECAILVTSRYEEEAIRSRCARLGVRQIPKGMVPLVPIEVHYNI